MRINGHPTVATRQLCSIAAEKVRYIVQNTQTGVDQTAFTNTV